MKKMYSSIAFAISALLVLMTASFCWFVVIEPSPELWMAIVSGVVSIVLVTVIVIGQYSTHEALTEKLYIVIAYKRYAIIKSIAKLVLGVIWFIVFSFGFIFLSAQGVKIVLEQLPNNLFSQWVVGLPTALIFLCAYGFIHYKTFFLLRNLSDKVYKDNHDLVLSEDEDMFVVTGTAPADIVGLAYVRYKTIDKNDRLAIASLGAWLRLNMSKYSCKSRTWVELDHVNNMLIAECMYY